jgi:hypothetical protein
MQTSSEFRAKHQVVASFRILRDSQAKSEYTIGYGSLVSSGPADVIDLNGDGMANFKTTANLEDDKASVLFDEPSLVAPSYPEIQRVAKEAGKDLLTREDFGQGLFLARLGVDGQGQDRKPVQTDLGTADFLVASRQPWDPSLRYAVDTTAGEFLLYQ